MNTQCDYCIRRKYCTKIEGEDWSCEDYEENEKLFDYEDEENEENNQVDLQ